MKTQTITLQPPRRAGRALFIPRALFRTNSLPCLAFLILVSALPPIALVVLTTWATNAYAVLPVFQAAAGMSGFIFLALAVDSGRVGAALYSLSGVTLFGLAYASVAVTPEFLVVAAMVLAVWLGGGMFSQVRKYCL